MKTLFILHEASRTGASLMLLHFLEWIKNEKSSEVHISLLFMVKGELFGQFSKLADKAYNLDHPGKKNKILNKFRSKTENSNVDVLLKNLAHKNFDLIFANTVISIPIAYKLKKLNGSSKLIVYVHELENQINLSLPNLPQYSSEIDAFIGVSKLVKTTLVQNYSIDPEKVKVIYGFTKLMSAKKAKQKKGFTVLGIGTVAWPKRCDLFIQVAYFINKYHPEKGIKFKWVGAINNTEKILLNSDIQKAGLNGMVEFCDQQSNLEEVISNSQVLLMPSREESLGLVAIEAGMLGRPVVCFKKVSGFSEIMGIGGVQVPYLDVQAMAESIVDYFDNPNKLLEDGRRAQEICAKYTPDNQAAKIFQFILSI